jgi:predicted RNase H-like HicB family nuclease
MHNMGGCLWLTPRWRKTLTGKQYNQWLSSLISDNNYRRKDMKTKMTMIYWKGEKFWLGKLLEHPEIMTQGKSLKELEENIKDAYRLMVMEDVPEQYKVKAIAI